MINPLSTNFEIENPKFQTKRRGTKFFTDSKLFLRTIILFFSIVELQLKKDDSTKFELIQEKESIDPKKL